MSDRRRIRWNGYVDIADALRAMVVSGEVPPGALFPTERTLGTRLGASRATLRKAVDLLVEQGWAVRLPNRGVAAGRGIRPGTRRTVGVIHAAQPWFADVGRRIHGHLADFGFEPVDLRLAPDRSLEEALERARDEDMAGVVVWPFRGFVDDERIDRLALTLPVVALDHPVGLGHADRVAYDHEGATAAAVGRLFAQGRQRIALVGLADMLPATHERFRGYLRGIFDHGGKPAPRDFLPLRTAGSTDMDTLNLERRLADDDHPDGLVVTPPYALRAVRQALRRSRRRLGRDVDLAVIGGAGEPDPRAKGIAVVRFDDDTLARTAALRLAERLVKPDAPARLDRIGFTLEG